MATKKRNKNVFDEEEILREIDDIDLVDVFGEQVYAHPTKKQCIGTYKYLKVKFKLFINELSNRL